MKRRAAIVLAVAAGAAGLLAVQVATGVLIPGQSETRVNQQTFTWTLDPATTSSTEWERMPLDVTVCAREGATATLSVELSGAPVELRMRRSGVRNGREVGGLMRPGAVGLDPGAGGLASFTFVRPDMGGYYIAYRPQWRSPTGGEVRLEKGTLVVYSGVARDTACPD